MFRQAPIKVEEGLLEMTDLVVGLAETRLAFLELPGEEFHGGFQIAPDHVEFGEVLPDLVSSLSATDQLYLEKLVAAFEGRTLAVVSPDLIEELH